MTFTTQFGTGDSVTSDSLDEAQAKAYRNSLLAGSDKYVLEDYPTSKKEEWKTYRKALRDMDFSDPEKTTWPTKPE